VHDVVDEVEADGLRARGFGAGAEFRKCEGRGEHVVVGEGFEDVGGGRSVGACGVDRHGVGHSRDIPVGSVGAIAPGRGGESMVLHGHMRQQVGQVPAIARRRALQVFRGDAVDNVDGGHHRGAMDGTDVLISKHE
jgi:hypothetical protein